MEILKEFYCDKLHVRVFESRPVMGKYAGQEAAAHIKKLLAEKEVINVCDGKRLGCVSEVEFNVCDGRLTAIIVPVEGGFLGFGGKERIVIPWEKIERIGEDVIWVKRDPS